MALPDFFMAGAPKPTPPRCVQLGHAALGSTRRIAPIGGVRWTLMNSSIWQRFSATLPPISVQVFSNSAPVALPGAARDPESGS
jgi:hypothetical protein